MCSPGSSARQVRNFKAGLELMVRIGAVAEEEGHHPDLHLEGWNKVYAVMSTHSIGMPWHACRKALTSCSCSYCDMVFQAACSGHIIHTCVIEVHSTFLKSLIWIEPGLSLHCLGTDGHMHRRMHG